MTSLGFFTGIFFFPEVIGRTNLNINLFVDVNKQQTFFFSLLCLSLCFRSSPFLCTRINLLLAEACTQTQVMLCVAVTTFSACCFNRGKEISGSGCCYFFTSCADRRLLKENSVAR